MKIYVAGPLTQGNQMQNIRTALDVSTKLVHKGHTPFVPHLSFFWEIAISLPYETWMKMDFDWIKVCDALYRMPGFSPGADREESLAKELGIPVYRSLDEVPTEEK